MKELANSTEKRMGDIGISEDNQILRVPVELLNVITWPIMLNACHYLLITPPLGNMKHVKN